MFQLINTCVLNAHRSKNPFLTISLFCQIWLLNLASEECRQLKRSKKLLSYVLWMDINVSRYVIYGYQYVVIIDIKASEKCDNVRYWTERTFTGFWHVVQIS